MNDIDTLKNKIKYRAEYRGHKELDLLLSSFVKNYINQLNLHELNLLIEILNKDDETLYNWYMGKEVKNKIPKNKISVLLKNFKFK